FNSFSLEREPHWIGCVMWDGERHYFDVSNDETPSRLKKLYAFGIYLVPGGVFVISTPSGVSWRTDVNRQTEFLGHHVEAANVVGVLVRDQDGVYRFGSHACLHHAAAEFTTGESTVHEQTSAAGDNNRTVAFAAAR